MKKYTVPALRVMEFAGDDIIQTSGTQATLPTNVVKGANGTTVTATGYGSTSFNSAYGITSVTD